MSLTEYRKKRHFDRTSEPKGKVKKSKGQLRFFVQKHAASHTHFDFRLELDGTLKSWAVPKGPSMNPLNQRLALQVEDHPIEYGNFEGAIPKGNYGAGTVMVWDLGNYRERNSKGRKDSEIALKKGLIEGKLTLILEGEKLRGEFALVKLKGKEGNAWLLVKKRDEEANFRRTLVTEDRSALSGRSMQEIAREAESQGAVWTSGKRVTPPRKEASSLPHRLKPLVPVEGKKPDSSWVVGPDVQGTRAIAEVENQAKLHSRSLIPLNSRFPKVIKDLSALSHTAVLDGEILDERFIIWDLLYLDGKDWREESWSKRRAQLEKLRVPKGVSLIEMKEPDSGFAIARDPKGVYHSGVRREWVRYKVSPGGAKKESSERPPLTHPSKIFFPRDKITKSDLAKYYEAVAPFLLPHLKDRPMSLHRQPDGITVEGFYQKDMSGYVPKRVKTVRITSVSAGKTINYPVCQDLWTLLYLVNLGCIELHPWLSRTDALDRPDYALIDLDPDDNPFDEVVAVAREFEKILKAIKAPSFVKTSGATGIHILVPTGGKFSYDDTRGFVETLCAKVHERFPKNTSMERNPARRRGKIYLDYLQNRRGQTMASPYCVRPKPRAPVSTPLEWSEVKRGLDPGKFTIRTILSRLEKMGDVWSDLYRRGCDLSACLERL